MDGYQVSPVILLVAIILCLLPSLHCSEEPFVTMAKLTFPTSGATCIRVSWGSIGVSHSAGCFPLTDEFFGVPTWWHGKSAEYLNSSATAGTLIWWLSVEPFNHFHESPVTPGPMSVGEVTSRPEPLIYITEYKIGFRFTVDGNQVSPRVDISAEIISLIPGFFLCGKHVTLTRISNPARRTSGRNLLNTQ